MIRIESLTKHYGQARRRVEALRGVSLHVEPGVTAVVGPNGAGKTTLLGLVLGFLRPTSGDIRVDGLRPRPYLRRRGAAYLPERFRLPGQWRVRSGLAALARLEGHDAAGAASRTTAALDRLGLADHAHREVGTLSRGLHQRVGLAQALLAERDLVVLDEPTEGLDPLWRVRFREIVAELRGRGATVLLASHELAEVERLADRVVLLDDGRVKDVLEPGATPPGPTRYRIAFDGPAAALTRAFPAASLEAAGRDAAAAGAGTALVTVADAAELSHRLAAFIAGGGIVRAVTPAAGALEDRVRARLEGGP